MTINLDVVLMIEKIVTTNQEEMEISNQDVVLMIKKMETSSQDVASMMISQEDVLMIEKTVTISQDADSMMINPVSYTHLTLPTNSRV